MFKSVYIGKAIQYAFQLYIVNWKLVLLLALISFLFTAMLDVIRVNVYPIDLWSVLGLIAIALISIYASTVLTILFIKIGLKGFDSLKVLKFSDLGYPSFSLVLRFIIVILVFLLLIFLGTLILIFPGFIMLCALFFVTEVLVDQNLPAKKVFRISEKLTEGVKWGIFGLIMLYLTVSLALSIAFFVQYGFELPFYAGLAQRIIISFIISPLVIFASTYLYKDLKQQQEAIDTPDPMPDPDDPEL